MHKDDLDGAIEVCSHVEHERNGEDASQCATGVYMEYSAGVSRYPLTTEICEEAPFARACWLRLWVGRMPQLRGMKPGQDLCSEVKGGAKAHADCVYGEHRGSFWVCFWVCASERDCCYCRCWSNWCARRRRYATFGDASNLSDRQ